jgi:hypothetical protein
MGRRYIYTYFFVGRCEGSGQVDGMIILKCILDKYGGRGRSGLFWLRVGMCGRLL